MNKNLVKFLSMAAMLATVGAGLVACGNSDVPPGSENGTSKKEIYTAYCEFAGNMFMAEKGDLGPLPARTVFYDDYSWEAHATGKAMYSDFIGTWDYNGGLSMKLVEQDGYPLDEADQAVELDTTDDRVWTWTLSHWDDRGTGLKYHKNHMSKYGFLKAYNEALGKTEALPAEPTFTYTFDKTIWVSAGWAGEKADGEYTGEMGVLSGKVGDEVTLPECGYTREGYTFSGYTIFNGTKDAAKPGDKIKITDWDIMIRSNFTQNK